MWLGVPYQHRGRSGTQGVDCLGLIFVIYQGMRFKPYKDYDYTFDWALHADEDRYLDGLKAHGREIPRDEILPGDIHYFRINSSLVTHAGVALKDRQFVHALSGRKVAISNLLDKFWKNAYAGTIRLKMVEEQIK